MGAQGSDKLCSEISDMGAFKEMILGAQGCDIGALK
jgi:hypothetical protein